MISSENVTATDIAKKLKDEFSLIQTDSVIKRIRRFFKNKLFNGYHLYDKFIRFVIKTYKKKHDDKRVHIIFDHMFSHANFTVFMISIGHIYCIRLKGGFKVHFYDKKENHYIWVHAKELKSYEYHPAYYPDIEITHRKFKTNIVISKRHGADEPWIIVTNNNVQRAIKDYGYRYGGVETIFKNQKSNGFNLEKVVNASLKYFESMYSILCIAITFMVIIGCDYSKNVRCYKTTKITTHKILKSGHKQRTMSLFNVGLTLFNMALNSSKYIRIPYTFILYDS